MADEAIPEIKACTKCGETKPLSAFARSKLTRSGVRAACKVCSSAAEAARLRARGVAPLRIEMPCADCGQAFIRTATLRTRCDDCRAIRRMELHRKANRKYEAARPPRQRDPDESRERNKRYAERHPERVLHRSRRYNDANREEINRKARERNRTAKRKDYMRQWDREYRSRPRNRLDQRMKAGVAHSLRGGKAGRSWESLLGYTVADLAVHIEKQFLPGMGWHNMGKWHVDHVVPKSAFTYESADDPEFRAAWALTNLRPLWALANLSKGAKRLHLV